MLERGRVGRQGWFGVREGWASGRVGRGFTWNESWDRCLILMNLADGRDLESIAVTVYGVASSGKGAT